jgi:hypothetical protein
LQLRIGSNMIDDRVQSPQLSADKPYKPKFHNAALYAKVEKQLPVPHQLQIQHLSPNSTAPPTMPTNTNHLFEGNRHLVCTYYFLPIKPSNNHVFFLARSKRRVSRAAHFKDHFRQ